MLGLGMIYQGLASVQGDLFTVYVNAYNMIRLRNGMQPGSYNVISRTNLHDRAIQVIFTEDFHDDAGPRKGSARVGLLGPGAITVSTSNVPAPLADQENATLLAIIQSCRQITSVIAR